MFGNYLLSAVQSRYFVHLFCPGETLAQPGNVPRGWVLPFWTRIGSGPSLDRARAEPNMPQPFLIPDEIIFIIIQKGNYYYYNAIVLDDPDHTRGNLNGTRHRRDSVQ